MLLAIETAFDALSVALVDGPRIVAEHHVIVGRGHAETLMPAVAAVVGGNGSRVTGIVVDVGPGSFTGLRVGIAAARALGLAWGVPITGVGSLTLIAAGEFAERDAARLAVVVDAGRGQVYWQTFDRVGCTPDAGPAAAPAGLVFPGVATASALPRAASIRFVPERLQSLAPIPLYLRAAEAVAA